jgi:hypothetical protein
MSDGARKVDAERRVAKERLDRRIRGLAALSDEQLIADAPANNTFSYPWHEMEMQRRLKDSIDALVTESRRTRWWGFWGTVAIAALTVVLIALTVVLAVRS